MRDNTKLFGRLGAEFTHHLCLAHQITGAIAQLGAGLGIGAVCAALAGASRVVVTDIERKGLDFALQSARDNGITTASAFRAMTWDWNAPPPDDLNGPFDVVLAGDVIYQDEHAPRLGQIL